MQKKLLVGLILGVSVFYLNTQSFATAISYADRTSWTSAVGSVTTEDYESYGWTGSEYHGANVTLGGINYSFLEVIYGVGALDYDAAYLSSSYLEWQSSPNDMVVTLSSATNNLAFDFGEFYGSSGLNLSVTLDTGDSWVVSTVANDYSFFGITSDTSFTSLTLNADRNYAIMDNLSFAAAGNAPVPEPATMLLFGTGLAGFAGSKIRRKKKA